MTGHAMWSLPLIGLCAVVGCAATPGAKSPGDAEVRTVHSQPCWVLRSGTVELAVTQTGAHMAPVTFYRDGGEAVQPYYISPWQDEKLEDLPAPVLTSLRGDFFCMPFGANAKPYRGEQHPPHGEVAGSEWTFVSQGTEAAVHTLTLSLQPRVRRGTVTKRISLVEGQNVIYTQERLEGFSGPMSLGHHATLRVPEAEGSIRVATSPFRLGMTCPVLFGDPANREYQSFAIGERFTDLARVPLLWKEPAQADATRFPARTGFTDLLAVFSSAPAPASPRPAWVAATNQAEGYLWFALKDPAVLPATVFWISNRGRHGAPWNGRNRCLGLEDVCGYFAEGLHASAEPNLLSQQGIPTAVQLSPDRPFMVNYIQGVAKIPAGFDTVQTVEFEPGRVTFVSTTGKRVTAEVRHEFLYRGTL